MKLSALQFVLSLLVAVMLVTACEEYPAEQVATVDSVISEPDTDIVSHESRQPLDLTITPEMLEQIVVENDEVGAENQLPLQLLDKKEKDIQFKGRLLLGSNENALLPSIEGAVVEIQVKTNSL